MVGRTISVRVDDVKERFCNGLPLDTVLVGFSDVEDARGGVNSGEDIGMVIKVELGAQVGGRYGGDIARERPTRPREGLKSGHSLDVTAQRKHN